jgi:hypothetical protein
MEPSTLQHSADVQHQLSDSDDTPAAGRPTNSQNAPAGASTGEDDLSRVRSWAQGAHKQIRALEAFAQVVGGRLDSIDHQLQGMAAAVADAQAMAQGPAGPDPYSIEALIGYKPTPAQQAELWGALAKFQASLQLVQKNRGAAFKTKEREGRASQEVSYGYADLGAVMAAAYKAGEHGISIVCVRVPPPHPGDITVVALALHSGGGAISSGLWSAPPADSSMASQHQRVSMALTTARRVLVQLLLGIAPEEEDGGGAEGPHGAPAAGRRGRAAPPSRPPGAATATSAQSGPPPGWLSKAERLALEAELADVNITPERFQEIENRLQAAAAAATPRKVAG